MDYGRPLVNRYLRYCTAIIRPMSLTNIKLDTLVSLASGTPLARHALCPQHEAVHHSPKSSNIVAKISRVGGKCCWHDFCFSVRYFGDELH